MAAGAWRDYHESIHARLPFLHSSTDDAVIQEELRRSAQRQRRSTGACSVQQPGQGACWGAPRPRPRPRASARARAATHDVQRATQRNATQRSATQCNAAQRSATQHAAQRAALASPLASRLLPAPAGSSSSQNQLPLVAGGPGPGPGPGPGTWVPTADAAPLFYFVLFCLTFNAAWCVWTPQLKGTQLQLRCSVVGLPSGPAASTAFERQSQSQSRLGGPLCVSRPLPDSVWPFGCHKAAY
jgi:hypothetical protein